MAITTVVVILQSVGKRGPVFDQDRAAKLANLGQRMFLERRGGGGGQGGGGQDCSTKLAQKPLAPLAGCATCLTWRGESC